MTGTGHRTTAGTAAFRDMAVRLPRRVRLPPTLPLGVVPWHRREAAHELPPSPFRKVIVEVHVA